MRKALKPGIGLKKFSTILKVRLFSIQNQPKMLVLNKQVVLSVDTHLDQPEARRVTFYTGKNNIFYLELAIDRTEFIKLHDFEAGEVVDPDALIAQAHAEKSTPAPTAETVDHEELMKSLGM